MDLDTAAAQGLLGAIIVDDPIIILTDLLELLEIECLHKHVTTNSNVRFGTGDV